MGYFGRTALGISKMKTQLQPHAAINERLSKSTWQYPVSVLYTAAYFAAQRSFTHCLDTFLVLFLDKFPGTWQIAANSTITLLAFTRPFIHSVIHSFSRVFMHSFSHSFTHSACHSLSSDWQMRIVRVRRVWRVWHAACCMWHSLLHIDKIL